MITAYIHEYIHTYTHTCTYMHIYVHKRIHTQMIAQFKISKFGSACVQIDGAERGEPLGDADLAGEGDAQFEAYDLLDVVVKEG